MSKKVNPTITILQAAILCLILVACNDIKLTSKWQDQAIEIDGFQMDWEGKLIGLPATKVNIGVANDAEFFYLCLVPLDSMIARQAMGFGMTIWFESEESNKIGIKYPLGFRLKDKPLDELREKNTPEERREFYESSLREIEILGEDKDVLAKLPSVNTAGIDAKISDRHGRFVYELKIPLQTADNFPYAINAKGGNIIKIRIKTPKMESRSIRKRPEGRDRTDGGMRPPGGIGEGGGPPGGMRGGSNDRSGMPEPLNLQMTVRLAVNDDNKTNE